MLNTCPMVHVSLPMTLLMFVEWSGTVAAWWLRHPTLLKYFFFKLIAILREAYLHMYHRLPGTLLGSFHTWTTRWRQAVSSLESSESSAVECPHNLHLWSRAALRMYVGLRENIVNISSQRYSLAFLCSTHWISLMCRCWRFENA